MDGQGGGIGRALAETIRAAHPELRLRALGTNALATAAMLKAGADQGATGENAIRYQCKSADVIVGVTGLLNANAMLGEVSPAIAMAITNLSTDALLKRMKPQTLMTVGMILCGVCYVLMGAAPCQATYFLGGVGYGASMGFSYPVLTVMAVNGVPERRRGAATSTMLMAGDVGVGVGTFLWGAIIDGAGFTVSFLLAGISVVLGGVFSCLFYLGRKK